ncbi:MAG: uroporphyrinogen-III C-methyltransferase [Burkholderiaceae bacterium]
MSQQSAADRRYGKVWLVGAGPGASDLITVRGARVLAAADVVLYDALVTEDMLALCPQAEKISVGKRAGRRSTAQQVINEQLVDCAARYERIVRLKGGDPMLFGRADEELRALEAHGIEVEVVPGITAAMAGAAAAKQPLTKRGVARSVAFFTSSTAPDMPDHALLPGTDTLVQYMGGREALLTASRLLDKGFPSSLPIVIVESCSRPDERVWRTTLGELGDALPATSGPVLILIGEAMAERDRAAPDDATSSDSMSD